MKQAMTYQNLAENCARAKGVNLSISTKQAIEICNTLRGKKVSTAVAILEDVIAMKKAMPFKRFTDGLGHKSGMGAGRYPKNASTAILKLVKSAESNAIDKGLNGDSLIITHMKSDKAAGQFHPGRQRRRQMKQTHVEVVVREAVAKKRVQKTAQPKKTEEKKADVKPKTEAKQIPTPKKEEAKPAPKEAVKKADAPKKETKQAAKPSPSSDKKEEPKKVE